MSEIVTVNDPTQYVGVPTKESVNAGIEAFKQTGNYEYDSLDFTTLTPVPAGFITVACFAFRFDYWDFPSCIGMKSNCQFLCCQSGSYLCKPVTDGNVKCICTEDICEITNFAPTLNCYRQCCCIELICGLPGLTGYVPMNESVKSDSSGSEAANQEFVLPCIANCCVIQSCFVQYPQCIGCFGKDFCCCVEGFFTACKPLFLSPDRTKKNILCLTQKTRYYVVGFKPQIKSESQMCCRDSRSAFPCDDDVPCLCSYMFLTCFVNFKPHFACFSSLKDIVAFANDNPSEITKQVQNSATKAQEAADNATQK